MMTLEEARAVVADVAFPGYRFRVEPLGSGAEHFYLQAHFDAPDVDAPDQVETQATRKWLVSRHMTRSELVQTALKCVLTSVEHEAREQFAYRGRRVFGPHLSVEVLARIADEREARL